MLLLTSVLPMAAALRPRAMRQQIADGHGKVVIRIHQSGRRCYDAVPIRVRVVGECDAILIFQADEPAIA
jgi:hypothetical protein